MKTNTDFFLYYNRRVLKPHQDPMITSRASSSQPGKAVKFPLTGIENAEKTVSGT